MYIIMWVGGMAFNGDTIPSGKSLGGSESAAYYMAKELVELGHNVTVFTSEKKGGVWDGVRYAWMGEADNNNPLGRAFQYVAQVPHDVMIVQRHPLGFVPYYNSKLNIWWMHDFALKRQLPHVNNQLAFIDQIFTVSEWHKNQVAGVYNINPEYITATRNGLCYDMYEGVRSLNLEREPNSLIFASRPERGLENLVKKGGIMEQLPECRLYVCGYDNTVAQMEQYYKYLWQRCEELPNVVDLGAIGKEDLAKKMSQCMIYAYPTTFEDTSCMISLEANAVGLPFVGFQTAALPETMQNGGASLLPLDNGQVNEKLFKKEIRRILKTDKWSALNKKALEKRQTWQDVAFDWDACFNNLLLDKFDFTRLEKHLEKMSDIVALEGLYIRQAKEVPDRIRNLYWFYFDNEFETHYRDYYQYEADRGVVYGPEDLSGQARFEEVANIIDANKPERILDFGCAHGHYTMNLLARFPFIKEIMGVDLDKSNITKAEEWANQVCMKDRTKFRIGDHDVVLDNVFDVIILGEVLEHVAYPAMLVQSLIDNNSVSHTLFIITVPYGAWEAIGYKLHPEWRAHLYHLEKADLFELFGNQTDYKLLGVPHSQGLGHLICQFKPSNEKVGKIDYDRKLLEQAPRETVSVCIIAKDEALTIGKTLKTVEDLADEIIIGIDENTVDNTREICEKFGAKCIDVPSPIEIGFDEARNYTIREASMDWIFWLDADETLEQAENIDKYLRPSQWAGFAVKQHHFCVDPAAMLMTTDYPVRLFRNNINARFIGFVHEHPEVDHNESVGRVIVLPDVSILHTGYMTERIRRERFNRNFPLMQKDREKYPDRKLGKFLYLRDLMHWIKFTMEANGNAITPEIRKIAENVISLWRELLDMGETRFILDSMVWYSDAVKVFGGGIDAAILVEAEPSNGNNAYITKVWKDEVIKGTFLDKNDIEKLQQHLLNTKIDQYFQPYF